MHEGIQWNEPGREGGNFTLNYFHLIEQFHDLCKMPFTYVKYLKKYGTSIYANFVCEVNGFVITK